MKDEEGFDREILSDVQAERTELKAKLLRAESLTAEAVAKEAARWRLRLSEGCPECGYVQERPIKNCGHVGSDGCCEHPKNMTPECHADACPLVTNQAQHDASVAAQAVKPWREGIESIRQKVKESKECADGSNPHCPDDFGCHDEVCYETGWTEIIKNCDALLAAAPAPSEEKP